MPHSPRGRARMRRYTAAGPVTVTRRDGTAAIAQPYSGGQLLRLVHGVSGKPGVGKGRG